MIQLELQEVMVNVAVRKPVLSALSTTDCTLWVPGSDLGLGLQACEVWEAELKDLRGTFHLSCCGLLTVGVLCGHQDSYLWMGGLWGALVGHLDVNR